MWETFSLARRQQTGRERRKRAHMLKRDADISGILPFSRGCEPVPRFVALVIALGMIVLPPDAWYVVAANWDPLQQHGRGAGGRGQRGWGGRQPWRRAFDVGAQVVAQLHDNHEMGWNSPTPRRP